MNFIYNKTGKFGPGQQKSVKVSGTKNKQLEEHFETN